MIKIIKESIVLDTKGNPDLIDVTNRIKDILKSSGLKRGNITVFVVGSTAAIATFEYEPGMIADIQEL